MLAVAKRDALVREPQIALKGCSTLVFEPGGRIGRSIFATKLGDFESEEV